MKKLWKRVRRWYGKRKFREYVCTRCTVGILLNRGRLCEDYGRDFARQFYSPYHFTTPYLTEPPDCPKWHAIHSKGRTREQALRYFGL